MGILHRLRQTVHQNGHPDEGRPPVGKAHTEKDARQHQVLFGDLICPGDRAVEKDIAKPHRPWSGTSSQKGPPWPKPSSILSIFTNHFSIVSNDLFLLNRLLNSEPQDNREQKISNHESTKKQKPANIRQRLLSSLMLARLRWSPQGFFLCVLSVLV